MAEFASPVDAVEAAIEIQNRLTKNFQIQMMELLLSLG